MKYCNKCGTKTDEGDVFCSACGAPIGAAAAEPAPEPAPAEPSDPVADKVSKAVKKFLDTHDSTPDYDDLDVKNNKGISVLCYLGPLLIIPWLARRDSRFAQFHVNQGMLLLILELVVCFIWFIPVVKWIVCIVAWIGFVVWSILGIINAVSGKAKCLPLIGKVQLID